MKYICMIKPKAVTIASMQNLVFEYLQLATYCLISKIYHAQTLIVSVLAKVEM